MCSYFALCKLTTPDTLAKSLLLSDEFDIIIESEGRVKLASMYRERRFTKLSKIVACVVKGTDLYNKLLEHTSKKNLFVKT